MNTCNKMVLKYTVNDLVKNIDSYEIQGNDEEIIISNAKPIHQANENSIVWLKHNIKDSIKLLENTKARVIICSKEQELPQKNMCFILVENPKLVFSKLVKSLFVKKVKWGIHSSAIIHENAVLAKEVFIGPNTYIGESEIGHNSIIFGNCYIYDNVKIGENVTIHAGTVIGADGFGYSRDENNEFESFPHIGGVLIENNVDIGSNTSIDRGALGDTVIKSGAKIDNLVHIAHNVVVGKHTAVIANAMIGGSVEISDYSWIAPSASVMNQKNVGRNATLGMGAVLTKNIPDNEVWTGSPAKPLKEFIEIQSKIKKL